MTKPRPRLVIEGAGGRVVIRCWGKGWRIKATAYDGDVVKEMALATHAASLLQEITRSMFEDPDLKLLTSGIRHIADHETVA